MRADRGKRLTILSESEKSALYGLPDFDDFQRAEFFSMTNAERTLAFHRKGLEEQIFCLLQIGYFKAKQAFFRFTLHEVAPADITFLLERYFPHKTLVLKRLKDNEYYAPRKDIAALFGYRLWSNNDLPIFNRHRTHSTHQTTKQTYKFFRPRIIKPNGNFCSKLNVVQFSKMESY